MTCLANPNYTRMRGLTEVQAAVVVAKTTRSMLAWTVVEFAEAASKGLPFYSQFAPSQDPYPHIGPRSTASQELRNQSIQNICVLGRLLSPCFKI